MRRYIVWIVLAGAGALEYLAALRNASPMEHWQKDSKGARLLEGAVRNDHV